MTVKLVVDASVALTWLIPEALTSQALALIDLQYDLIAPDYILPEVYNVVGKKVSRRELTLDEAFALMGIFSNQPVTLRPFRPLLQDAFRLAIVYDRAVYDCIYLALAIVEGCRLVTADRKFVNGLKHSRLATGIKWLGDM